MLSLIHSLCGAHAYIRHKRAMLVLWISNYYLTCETTLMEKNHSYRQFDRECDFLNYSCVFFHQFTLDLSDERFYIMHFRFKAAWDAIIRFIYYAVVQINYIIASFELHLPFIEFWKTWIFHIFLNFLSIRMYTEWNLTLTRFYILQSVNGFSIINSMVDLGIYLIIRLEQVRSSWMQGSVFLS